MAAEKFLAPLPAFYTCIQSTEWIVFKTLAVVINIYSSWLQQNGELTFDISLETRLDNISLKTSKYSDIRSLN